MEIEAKYDFHINFFRHKNPQEFGGRTFVSGTLPSGLVALLPATIIIKHIDQTTRFDRLIAISKEDDVEGIHYVVDGLHQLSQLSSQKVAFIVRLRLQCFTRLYGDTDTYGGTNGVNSAILAYENFKSLMMSKPAITKQSFYNQFCSGLVLSALVNYKENYANKYTLKRR